MFSKWIPGFKKMSALVSNPWRVKERNVSRILHELDTGIQIKVHRQDRQEIERVAEQKGNKKRRKQKEMDVCSRRESGSHTHFVDCLRHTGKTGKGRFCTLSMELRLDRRKSERNVRKGFRAVPSRLSGPQWHPFIAICTVPHVWKTSVGQCGKN